MGMTNLEILFWYLLVVCQGNIARKENVIILMDVDQTKHSLSSEVLKRVLDGISLRRYRIAFHSTNGVSKRVNEFQSKKCLLQNFQNLTRRFQSLGKILKIAATDIFHEFSQDKYILLLITEQILSTHKQSLLTRIARRGDVFVVYLSSDKSTSDVKNLVRYVTSMEVGDIIKSLPFLKDNLKLCTSPTKDECGRTCDCVHGRLTNCYRVRQEFSSMSLAERERYTNAFKEISTNKRYKHAYEKYSQIHHLYFIKGIHKVDQFFPWHRKYLLGYENLLRLVDCRVTVPVWNWALYSEVLWSITPSYHMWKHMGGFGGNGDFSSTFCVTTGKFKYSQWTTLKNVKNESLIVTQTCAGNISCVDKALSNSIYTNCLRRRFGGESVSLKAVKHVIQSLSNDKFNDLDAVVRADWHNRMHNGVGGHMATVYASYSPEFWSHHAMLDSIWDEWQKKGQQYKFAAFPERDTILIAYEPKEYHHWYVDNDDLGGCGIRVKYDGIFKDDKIVGKENDLIYLDKRLTGASKDTKTFKKSKNAPNTVFRRSKEDQDTLQRVYNQMPFLYEDKEIFFNFETIPIG